ncbi:MULTISPECIES: glycosyltransferase [Chelativorans]|uniref:Glycosyl transferase, family 2 n=1 Tax=Chelativorans sp. (strain BNC1) TaxID=266779 RepID=Q11EB9_CHESB|nr:MULTISPECIES: glycosyltransferase [Chelativorans]
MSVSIIIKTLNEEKRIASTIEHALAGLPGGLGEVIVADSGSTDRTAEIVSHYPVTMVQIIDPAKPSCGLGGQLGFQYARYDLICLLDGDMDLEPSFLPDAINYLQNHTDVAGVTGHVQEMNLSNLEFSRRVTRNAPENRVGEIDRMNGGGLYRRAAIESIGYLTDRNLHGYEEFDLGIRLRNAGWRLVRLDRRFVQHYGHVENSYRLLVRRWKSKYLFGIGELLRAAMGKPHFLCLLKELPELRLWGLVLAWMVFALALLVVLPNKLLALGIVLATFAFAVAVMSLRKGGLAMGLYVVVAWFFHAAALPVGFLRSRVDPKAWVESRKLNEG